ncbi:MAG: DNA internalization-related competence protein ComEC/Rec2 [Planctomyces sp.]|jgi:competence protein ComEC
MSSQIVNNAAAWLHARLVSVPAPLRAAVALIAGIRAADQWRWPTVIPAAVALVALLLSLPCRRRAPVTEQLLQLTSLLMLGGMLWSLHSFGSDGRRPASLLERNPQLQQSSLRLTGTVAGIPSTAVADAAPAPAAPAAAVAAPQVKIRTHFLLHAESAALTDHPESLSGLCRITVDGDVSQMLSWGDRVELTGRLELPPEPMNPGEFDYARYLRRSGISAVMFLRHPAAIRMLESAGTWSARGILNRFRCSTVQLLQQHLSPSGRAAAEALLLGNRGWMSSEVERQYTVSGTMHLLAISGLHVGILYVFIVRVFHLLLVPRSRGLVLAATVCLLYAFLTDLRPSVLRSSLFILLSVIGQLLCREMRLSTLIGLTVLILAIIDPAVAFDVGAWLSFLAVAALGWVSAGADHDQSRSAPPDAVTMPQRLLLAATAAAQWTLRCSRQMLAVTMLSAPLVASQFHLVTLTGMVVNLVLIPLTTAVLIAGYIFVAVGSLIPPLATIVAWPFSGLLELLNLGVAYSASVRSGYLLIPDLPGWFLPVWYTLLLAAAATRPPLRRCLQLAMVGLLLVLFPAVCSRPVISGMVCTVLSVGHGNAVVVEADDRVLLFDAGAMHRGKRTADLVAGFLWHRGHRMIDAIILSHPDADHYNAVPDLLEKMPVGQVLASHQFFASDSPEIQRLLTALQKQQIPATILQHGDSLRLAELHVDFLQGQLDSAELADNESSLAAVLRCRGQSILLPGDLEGSGLQQLLSRLPACSLLVSPHHGSPAANPPELARQVRPAHVIVSDRDERHQARLRKSYPDSQLLFTGRAGAVESRIDARGRLIVSSFR